MHYAPAHQDAARIAAAFALVSGDKTSRRAKATRGSQAA